MSTTVVRQVSATVGTASANGRNLQGLATAVSATAEGKAPATDGLSTTRQVAVGRGTAGRTTPTYGDPTCTTARTGATHLEPPFA